MYTDCPQTRKMQETSQTTQYDKVQHTAVHADGTARSVLSHPCICPCLSAAFFNPALAFSNIQLLPGDIRHLLFRSPCPPHLPLTLHL